MAKTCPICGKAALESCKPFCSKRCADLDLGKWFSGSYAVPAVENDDEPDMDAGSQEPPTEH